MMRLWVACGAALACVWTLAQEIPAPPAPGRLFPEWAAIQGQAELDARVSVMEETPKAVWSADRAMRLPVAFAGTRAARMNWDVRLKADLRLAKGVQFDFYCADLTPFSSFSLYFRSGKGWYHASFSPERTGAWQRITVDRTGVREEGDPAGWENVDLLRFSAWRCRDADTVCALANLGPAGDEPDVLVVRAESNVAAAGNEGKAFGTYADSVSVTLDRLGIASAQVADTALASELLERVKLVVLPYNPSVPPAAADLLRAFSARGGKLLACYALPPETAKLLGLKRSGGAEAEGGAFAGFARTAEGLERQPDFAPQASWRTTTAVSAEGQRARVVAVWRDAQGRDTPLPAVTVTPAGAFIGHVWFGSSGEASLGLMRALVGALDASVWRKASEHAFARIGAFAGAEDFGAFRSTVMAGAPKASRRALAEASSARAEAERLMAAGAWSDSLDASARAADAARRAWFLMQKPVKGEHRAFWCHSAFGLRGQDWDASIRFLKENGFTAILPNMLWGGTAYYPSKVLPEYPELAQKGDQIAQCLAACRKYGVKCHVWKVNWNMSSHAPKDFMARMAAEGRVQKLYDGETKAEWLCPSHPANQAQEVAAMLEIVRNYAVDGVHFDYIRYPDNSSCFCDGCRARFEARLGHAVAAWPADTRKDEQVQAAWLDFRRSNIDGVVRQVAEEARRIRPGVEISAAVFRNWPVDRDGVGQDWKMWCEQGWLDFVCPMDYVDSNALFRNMVASQIPYAGQARLYPGIGLSCWKDPRDAVKLAEQIGVVRELGVPGFTVFNYDANAEATLPSLRLGVTAPCRSWWSRVWPF